MPSSIQTPRYSQPTCLISLARPLSVHPPSPKKLIHGQKNSAHFDAYLKSTFIYICLVDRPYKLSYRSLFERIFANIAKNSAHYDAYLKSTFIYVWLLERLYEAISTKYMVNRESTPPCFSGRCVLRDVLYYS